MEYRPVGVTAVHALLHIASTPSTLNYVCLARSSCTRHSILSLDMRQRFEPTVSERGTDG